MMISLALIIAAQTTPTLERAEPGRQAVSCSVSAQSGFSTKLEHVSAIRCHGVFGFFVPSKRYRELSELAREAPFRDRERTLLRRREASLEKAVAAKDEYGESQRQIAASYRNAWEAAERARVESDKDLVEAARRAWYESPALWAAVGGAVTIAAILLGKKLTDTEAGVIIQR